jgi:hypothetical protein
MMANQALFVACFQATALFYAADKFKDDKEIVLAAVNACSVQFESVSETLKADPDVIAAAGVQQDLGSFTY